MVGDEWDDDPPAHRLSLRSFLIRDWPYIAMLVLGIFGVALTSYARPAVTTFWIILCPVFGIICVAARLRGQGPGGGVATHPGTVPSLACCYVCDLSRVCGGRKANDERGRKCTHGADLISAGHVYGWQLRRRLARLPGRYCTRSWSSCRRLARTINTPPRIDRYCVDFDRRNGFFALRAGHEVGTVLNSDHFQSTAFSRYLRGGRACCGERRRGRIRRVGRTFQNLSYRSG